MRILLSIAVLCFATASYAVPIFSTTQGEEANLAALYGSGDLIDGLIPVELAGDAGWHPANTIPADQLPAFTDGNGFSASNLQGLLNDFPAAGAPTKIVQYTLGAATDIDEIRVFSGNRGRDGRVFHTYTVEFSSDGGGTFGAPIYVQSHASGTVNPQWEVALTRLTDNAGSLATGVTDMIFSFYGVDNTLNEMRDPFDGVNPFTGFDDGLNAPNTSPLILEIDVNPVPEPSTIALVLCGLAGLVTIRRRR